MKRHFNVSGDCQPDLHYIVDISDPFNSAIEIGEMLGFIRNDNGAVVIANRIFETYF